MQQSIDPSARERWIAVGLLLGVLALAYLVGLHWWWGAPMLERQQQIDTLRAEERRLRSIAGQRSALEKRVAHAISLEQRNPGFLSEATVGLATAGLVQRLERGIPQSRDASSTSCTISNRAPINSRAKERFPRVALQVRLRCNIAQFADILLSLESSAPKILIDNVSIQNHGYGSYGSDTTQSSDQIDISFEMYGYLRQAEATASNRG